MISVANKEEKLKTRPDLTDEQYLAYLTGLPENHGIDVRGLYLDMHEWCAKKRKTPNRKRLLNWIAREREDMPMTMLPSNDVMRKTTAIDAAEPICKTCNDTGEIICKPAEPQYDWERMFLPCPDCTEVAEARTK